MAAALLSHFPPQVLDLWDSNSLTGTPSLEARTTFHRPCANPGLLMSLRLGGTETLCHHAITHTHTTTLVQDVAASSKFFFSHIKTSLFLLGIWIPAFTFQAFTSMTLALPYIQSRTKHLLYKESVLLFSWPPYISAPSARNRSHCHELTHKIKCPKKKS